MENFHALIKDRGGNGLDIPKFHLILHFVRNILCRLGGVPQYDGSTLESSAKYLANVLVWDQKHHKSISIQTAIKYYEDLTILNCDRIYHADSKFQIHYNHFNGVGGNS